MTNGGRRSIFIVESDWEVGQSMAALFGAQGYEVSVFHSAEEAVESCLLGPPNMVIAEICSPGMDGIDLGIFLRQRYPQVLELLLTWDCTGGSYLRKVLACGYDFEILRKPIQPSSFIARVSELLAAA